MLTSPSFPKPLPLPKEKIRKMDSSWAFILVVILCISALLKSLFNLSSSGSRNNKQTNSQFLPLPPGPPTVPYIGNLLWLRKSFSELEPILRKLKAEHGHLIALHIGHRPAIFVGSQSLAHRALVRDGAIFSDRPKALPTSKIFNSNQHNISSAPYGPTWRLLRRNLTSEILHPYRIKSYSRARRWVLSILLRRFLAKSNQVDLVGVKVVEDFRYAMFCLLVLMCFGDKLEEKQIQEIEITMRRFLLGFGQFNLLNFWPRLGKILFRSRWKQLLQLRQDQEKLLIPLIRARTEAKRQRLQNDQEEVVVAYVDTLVDLELPDEKRKLNEGEMVSLCSEFLNGGTDTTATALQWIMANLVKYHAVQEKLYQEIRESVGPAPPLTSTTEEVEGTVRVIEEEDLQRMPYLKAVVLEGLRRHPPGHFVLPHAVTRDVELDGYVVPKNATVNFMVAEMGWDANVWEDPMEFKPERFLGAGNRAGEAFDITCSREIKMMPFGAGRRICPGLGLALLHLEYFVANLIWYFRWGGPSDGDEVDLSEKQEFTVVMKNPLRAQICPRL